MLKRGRKGGVQISISTEELRNYLSYSGKNTKFISVL